MTHDSPSGFRRAALITQFAKMVGANNVLHEQAEMAPHLVEWRDRWRGDALCVLKPGSTAEVSAILAIAQKEAVAVVPQGGNTGLVGGQIPDATGTQIVLNLSRMNRLRDLDADGETMTVEAGMTLAGAQGFAAEAGKLFPLSLASEGGCQIGGAISTNAGGTAVLAYGNMRSLVLGLEVVLPDGRVWNGLRRLRKDNTGYDLRDLFIGAEGTLGVVTAAVLRLFPRPAAQVTAFVGVRDLARMLNLFGRMRQAAGPALTGFEFMSRRTLDFVLDLASAPSDPLRAPCPFYALIDISGARESELRTLTEATLGACLEDGTVEDAVIAASDAQSAGLWRLRDLASEAQKPQGGSIKHDVSVPVARIPEFIALADREVERVCPGARPVAFGHFGDGNVHYNVTQPAGMPREAFLAKWEEMAAAVYAVVAALDGSISAEHGIGVLKRDALRHYKDEVELDLMRKIKSAFDPQGLMNPGKLL
jgi:FAD/FMN-containing dehydrogenase